MSLFLFAFFEIHDRPTYEKYMAAAKPIFMREGVNVLANDEAPIPMSPGIKADKVVLLEFRDEAHMRAFFALPDYIEAGKFRDASTTMNIIRFDRFDGL